ncbi:MAG: tRNA 2-thiouridine(34) synthase MnmA [Ruminococcaceae bacterium]|nr:tRNA 2-thiouridine(34) synthase MnmA [Oscillospiraceae bacterium]
MQTVAVGISGGVDSAVAALLLKRQGYRVIGVTMQLFGDRLPRTSGARDIDDARRVCEALGIEHVVADMSEAFCRSVVDEFAAEYRRGRTPNPCILCNRDLKFGAMWEFARTLGADAVATGHYVTLSFDEESGRWQLWQDPSRKDQSYMLWTLSQEQLSVVRFPLAGMEKEAVRALAKEAGLPVADKGDSMEICFVEDDDHAAFIERYTGIADRKGHFVDANGQVLGEHQGITHYTVGQRKGLGIALGRPMYVTALNAAANTVTLGAEGSQTTDLLTADSINFVSIAAPTMPIRVQAKIRYQALPADATLTVEGGITTVLFDTPQRAVTPGQSVVFYQDGLLLGGGFIR